MTYVELSRFPANMQALAMPYPCSEARPSTATPNPWTIMYRVFTATFGLSFIGAIIDQSAGAGIALIITAVCSGVGMIITKYFAGLAELKKLDKLAERLTKVEEKTS